MITAQTINQLYKKYRKKPKSLDDRNLSLLVDMALDTEALDLDGDKLVFNQLDQYSPFREIELERIHAAVDLGDEIAIVLPNSMIFVNKHNFATHVHFKPAPTGLMGRVRYLLEK